MNKKQKVIFSISIFALVVCYFVISHFIKNDIKITANNPKSIKLVSKPRLQDDFYDYINYDYLKEDHLNDQLYWSPVFYDKIEELEKEKEEIVKEIVSKCDTYDKNDYLYKICEFNDSFNNTSEEQIKEELNKYIENINSSTTIAEYVDRIIDINNELGTSILYTESLDIDDTNNDELIYSINMMSFFPIMSHDICEEDIYMLDTYPEIRTYLTKKSKLILEKYGYNKEEANELVNRVENMYNEIKKATKLKSNPIAYKLYTKDEIINELVNIDIDKITNNSVIYKKLNDKISVQNINNLKAVDSYLKEENLDVLKDYASLLVILNYYYFINEDYYKIQSDINEYIDFIINGNIPEKNKESITREEYKIELLNMMFSNELNNEVYKRNFTDSEIELYTNIIKDEIEVFKNNIDIIDWLDSKTKENAKKKLETMKYKVCDIDLSKSMVSEYDFSNNFINVIIKLNTLSLEKEIDMIINEEYGDSIDQSVINAFYMPTNNSISILMGMIYAIDKSYGITEENMNDKYYEILGSVGTIIGHELTHSLDSEGSKYDEYGELNNWWTDEDKLSFRNKNLNVVKYYDKYNINGATTVSENTADLGGMKIVLKIAENNNATNEDYKTIFESYAKLWCSQYSSLVTKDLLLDEHSFDKVRVNAVLSSTDKFYEIYNIKKSDKMYVEKKDRVYVW